MYNPHLHFQLYSKLRGDRLDEAIIEMSRYELRRDEEEGAVVVWKD